VTWPTVTVARPESGHDLQVAMVKEARPARLAPRSDRVVDRVPVGDGGRTPAGSSLTGTFRGRGRRNRQGPPL